jgi:threonine/homoserine/homoserine lactone efflux protein
MNIAFSLQGLVMGFSVAAVVGPIGVLCIQRTMHDSFLYGLVTGLGAATADAIYGSTAAFGLTVVTTTLVHLQVWIHLLGGFFLIYLGVRTLLRRPAEKAAQVRGRSYIGAYISTLLLTLTNPQTILSFAAIFAGLGIATSASPNNGASTISINSILVVSGVFLGSALWWVFLSGGLSILRGHFTWRWLLWINRLSGCIILVFGFYALYSLQPILAQVASISWTHS